MLEDMYKSYASYASGLGNYQAMSKTQLADGYVNATEAGDEIKRSEYYAALMLRYWYKIYEWNKTCASCRLDIEEFASWLNEAISYAVEHKAWRDPANKMYNDPNGPDKIINRCIASVRLIHYQEYNKDKRKANYTAESFDKQVELYGDSADVMTSSACNEYYNYNEGVAGAVQTLIQRGKIKSAIIVDSIIAQEAFLQYKLEKEIQDFDIDKNETVSVKAKVSEEEFSAERLARSLRKIDKLYNEYFLSNYKVNIGLYMQAVAELKALPTSRLVIKIQDTLMSLRDDEEILSFLNYRS